jgi:tRNA (guanosine-2'-O-)-methyltransferase
MVNNTIKMDNPKSSKRKRCDRAKKLRCTTFLAVLENPNNPANVGAIIRNIDVLGISKLYIVGRKFEGKKHSKIIHHASTGSSRYVYVKYFDTSKECIDYLNKNKYTSLVTSPHQKNKDNYQLIGADFTKYKKLAVWFGNEAKGISDEVVDLSSGCINIDMVGIGESLNLSNAA